MSRSKPKDYYYNQLQECSTTSDNTSTSASWVNLNASSRLSNLESVEDSVDVSYHVELEKLLHEAQREGSTPSQTSQNGSYASRDASDEENDSNNREINANIISVLPNVRIPPVDRNTEKVMSWASHPSNKPPKLDHQFQHPNKGRKRIFSLRKSSAMKNGLLSWEFLRIFIPSLFLTNLFTFGIGYYIGNKHGSIAVKAI